MEFKPIGDGSYTLQLTYTELSVLTKRIHDLKSSNIRYIDDILSTILTGYIESVRKESEV